MLLYPVPRAGPAGTLHEKEKALSCATSRERITCYSLVLYFSSCEPAREAWTIHRHRVVVSDNYS